MHYDRDRVVQKMRKWERHLSEYALPTWEELPALELYMDQVIVLLTEYLSFLPKEDNLDTIVTAAAINNYVRKKVMPPPVKKRYSRTHLAYLVMICSLKQCVNIPYIQQMIPITLSEQEIHDAYNAFVAQHRSTVLYFVEQMNERAGKMLNHAETADKGVSSIAGSLAVISGLSRLSAETLILLQESDEHS
jgi:hypothetical protein